MEKIPDFLSDYTKIINDEIQKIIPKNKKPSEVYTPIYDILSRGGKRFRAALCLLSCEAVGGRKALALPAAIGIELFHNFTLIHDDIEDNSLLRRGKPCLHLIYGVPLALNAGDGLFLLVWDVIFNAKMGRKKKIEIQKTLCSSFKDVLEGQGVELGWYRGKNWNISEGGYFKMIGKKAASLIACACKVGGMMGGGSEEEISALQKFGMEIGMGFQIQDDVLNLVGEERKYKKEIGGDITEGKRTLIVIQTLKKAKKTDRRKLLQILNAHTHDKYKIKSAISIIKEYGGIEYAKEKANELVRSAKNRLKIFPSTLARKRLEGIADFLIEREF